jgi:cell division inhibitor SulA/protein ImuA
MSADPRLVRLLEHPAIWRGRSAARMDAVPTGFSDLDASLPGNGWPRVGLVEVLIPHLGVGETALLLPALARLSSGPAARWCTWIAPPLEPFAPALSAHGVRLERLLLVRTASPLWACEQALRSGACDVALAWIRRGDPRQFRRLQLATEQGRTLGFVFRTLSARTSGEPSCATLRISVQPLAEGARVTLLKSRGGLRGSIDLALHAESGS